MIISRCRQSRKRAAAHTAVWNAASRKRSPLNFTGSPITTLQKTFGNRAVARMLGGGVVARKAKGSGSKAAASTNCAAYEADEVRKSRTQVGHLAGDGFIPGAMSLTNRPGDLLIVDFGVDRGSVKESTKNDPVLREWIDTFENNAEYQLEIEGYSDCVGEERDNQQLRQRRATKVMQLFSKARPRIVSHDAAAAGTYVRTNADAEGRATNRGVAIRFWRDFTFTPDAPIEGTIPKPPAPTPKPKPQPPKSVDCTTTQRDALARAFPVAIDMTRAAQSAISNLGPASRALLRKYFGPQAIDHRFHIKQNFASILSGLKSRPKFECEEADSYWCDGAVAYVFPLVGTRIHICAPAFVTDDFLARTIVHEAAHGYAFIFFPDTLCSGGCPTSMDTLDAEDNADSYAEFAGDALHLP